MTKQPECTGVFGRWFGHNYQPRYAETRTPPSLSNVKMSGLWPTWTVLAGSSFLSRTGRKSW